MSKRVHSCTAQADRVSRNLAQMSSQEHQTWDTSQSLASISALCEDADSVHKVLLRFPRWRSPAWWTSDSGAVTAEFAIILPAVMLIVLMLLTSARAATIALSCQDAARVTARTLIVEGDVGQAQSVAQSAMHSSVTVTVESKDTSIAVSTQCPVLPSVLSSVPFNVEGYAVALR